MEFLGMNLKLARIKECLSQEELAEKAGVSRQTIAKIEKDGPLKSKYEMLQNIANALGYTVNELFFKEN